MTETKFPEGEIVNCSFCGKPQAEVKKLIAGPVAYICNECIELCVDIISEDDVDEVKPSEEQLAAAWAGMLKNRALAARSAEQNLEKIVRQARAKGVDLPSIASYLGISVEEVESRYPAASS